MPTRKIVLLTAAVVLVVSAIIYARLGGFKQAEVALVSVKDGYRLIGKPYKGKFNHPSLNKLLDEVGMQWEAGEIPGVLTVVVLKEPGNGNDTTQQFIGILLPAKAPAEKLPQGYELLQIEASQAVRVSLEANSAVWPSPDKLRDKARAFAGEKGLRLAPNLLLEKYYGPNRLEVEIPATE